MPLLFLSFLSFILLYFFFFTWRYSIPIKQGTKRRYFLQTERRHFLQRKTSDFSKWGRAPARPTEPSETIRVLTELGLTSEAKRDVRQDRGGFKVIRYPRARPHTHRRAGRGGDVSLNPRDRGQRGIVVRTEIPQLSGRARQDNPFSRTPSILSKYSFMTK